MASDDKLINAIAKLNELTQDGKLKWGAYDPDPSLVDTNNKVDVVFKAEYKNKIIRIYLKKYKYYYDEDRFEWTDDVFMDLCASDGASLWEFPRVPGIGDLFDSVRFQAAGVKGFLDDILS